VDHHRDAHPDIDHQVILSDDPAHKQAQLLGCLEETGFDRALVFCNTRAGAERGGAAGWRPAALRRAARRARPARAQAGHGLFRDGGVPVLVASDVAARGLDVPGVELVINLDVPRSGDDYLHRSGRTGRAGRRGLTITLVSAPEWNRMESIERYLGLDVGRRKLEGLEASFKGAPKRPSPARRHRRALAATRPRPRPPP
jgi:ATP-dependent RNA helicase SrmB